MNQWQRDVQAFHEKFGCPVRTEPRPPTDTRTNLRIGLIHEEWEETRNAIRLGNIEKIADGLVDLLYVVIGAGVEYGIDLDAVWKEVHAANMRKDGGGVRDDGKIMKPVGWIGPNIRRALRREESK